MNGRTLPYTLAPSDYSTWKQTAMVKAHSDDAGYDLCTTQGVNLWPGSTVKLPTGVKLAIPEGFAGLVLPRSGLASKGITVANAPGLIDPGYRGEINVLLHYLYDPVAYKRQWFQTIAVGDRIAQFVLIETANLQPQLWNPFTFKAEFETERGEGGFGSTGR